MSWIDNAKNSAEEKRMLAQTRFFQIIPDAIKEIEEIMYVATSEGLTVNSKGVISYKYGGPGNFMEFSDGTTNKIFVMEWTVGVPGRWEYLNVTLGIDGYDKKIHELKPDGDTIPQGKLTKFKAVLHIFDTTTFDNSELNLFSELEQKIIDFVNRVFLK